MISATDETVTKRLHISGLTGQISFSDFQTRFSSFGNVKAVDGLGKLDANGDLRPYAYLTIESTKGQLAKCMNLLSGTTWKGAKLRIGEAKPDYMERIKAETESMKRAADGVSTQPRKRRRLLRGCKGVLASDMSLITSSNFSQRSLWRKTPLGRLIRPMRMRPGRPLPILPTPVSGGQKLALAQKRKREKKGKNGLVRQRRKLIDPELWGSEYLKGVMLESGTGVILPERRAVDSAESSESPDLKEADGEESNLRQLHEEVRRSPSPQPPVPVSQNPPIQTTKDNKQANIPPATRYSPPPPVPTGFAPENDLAREAAQSLSFLANLFGNASEESDWGGEESLSDLDVEASALLKSRTSLHAANGTTEEEEVEIVPRAKTVVKGKVIAQIPVEADSQEILEDDDETGIDETAPDTAAETPSIPQKSPAVHLTKLKAMFAPREEDVGFSILNNLDVDLELDETHDFPTTTQPTHSFSLPNPTALADQRSIEVVHPNLTYDPTKPLFFPREASFSSNLPIGKGKVPKDIIAMFHERGWTRDAFCRSESADEVRKRWEDCKVDLTKEWKRRHREAIKSARRRGGGRD